MSRLSSVGSGIYGSFILTFLKIYLVNKAAKDFIPMNFYMLHFKFINLNSNEETRHQTAIVVRSQ